MQNSFSQKVKTARQLLGPELPKILEVDRVKDLSMKERVVGSHENPLGWNAEKGPTRPAAQQLQRTMSIKDQSRNSVIVPRLKLPQISLVERSQMIRRKIKLQNRVQQ